MRIGPYEVGDVIARGGTSVVFRGRAPDGRPVALKLMRRQGGDAKRRVDREERLQTSLGAKEGFVPLLDKGETPEGAWIVMPFLAGGTLRGRLERGALGVAESASLVAALARAIGRAHELGVVHRDLKPENVLFDAGSTAPLIADLGLAKHFASNTPGASQSVVLSGTNEFRGTVGYSAPEQLRSAKDATPAADVFALGAILHECLAGAPAFSGAGIQELLARIEDGAVTPLRKLRPEVPAALARVVTRALAKSPGDRFADGAALAEAIDAALRAPTGAGRAPKVVLLSVVAVALLLLAGVGARRLSAARRQAARSERLAEARRVFATAADAAGWRRAADLLDAARSENAAGPFSAADERALVAARALAGAPDLAALAREAPSHDPVIDHAVAAVYSRALEDTAPIASLLELEKIPPPAAVRSRVAARWLEEAVSRARRQIDEDRITANMLAAPFGSDADRRKGIVKLIETMSQPFEALGRAFAADPGMNRFPRRLGPLFTIFRLTRVRIKIAQEPGLLPHWERALAPIAGHPLATWIALEQGRARGESQDDLVEPALAALEQLEAAPERTAHWRGIGQELLNSCKNARRPELIERLDRFGRYIQTDQAWNDIFVIRRGAGLPFDEAERMKKASRGLPKGAWELVAFDPEDEDPG